MRCVASFKVDFPRLAHISLTMEKSAEVKLCYLLCTVNVFSTERSSSHWLLVPLMCLEKEHISEAICCLVIDCCHL